MTKHFKKIIAPIIVTIFLLIYFSFIFWGIWESNVNSILGILAFLIPIGLMGATIYVLIERIKEIRSGEEDDISKY